MIVGHCRFFIGIGCIVVLSTGCNQSRPNTAAITGSVTLDGKPVEEGSILFLPSQGTPGSVAGGPITDGRYELSGKTGVAVGWNRVEIHILQKTGKMAPVPFSTDGKMAPEKFEAAPARYNTESTLKFEVMAGENTADFDLHSE